MREGKKANRALEREKKKKDEEEGQNWSKN